MRDAQGGPALSGTIISSHGIRLFSGPQGALMVLQDVHSDRPGTSDSSLAESEITTGDSSRRHDLHVEGGPG